MIQEIFKGLLPNDWEDLIVMRDVDGYLEHYGVGHENGGHSGRYPWGTGDSPYQRNAAFLQEVSRLKAEGFSEKDIAIQLHCRTTSELRNKIAAASNTNRKINIDKAIALSNQGMGATEIGREMGVNESTVRNWLKESTSINARKLENTMNVIRERVEEGAVIDVGKGVEYQIGVTADKLNKAVAALEAEGYSVHTFRVPQLVTNHETTMKVICKPDVEWKDIVTHPERVEEIHQISYDMGETFERSDLNVKYPASISSDRVKIRYAEEGGVEEGDGTMRIRRGVDDLSLNGKTYAQVRIAVDDSHYLKGMALYGDDSEFPPGVDIIFNTNKSNTKSKMEVLKEFKKNENGEVDRSNPFGATIRKQTEYTDPVTGEKKLSAINIVNDEGTWDTWSRTLSSQFLSKQPIELIKEQLNKTYDEQKRRIDDIMQLTNPTVKRKMLLDAAEELDTACVELQATAIPRMAAKVILPVSSLKDNEIYAPTFNEGEKVVLVRYPHEGTFQIPELTVTHSNKQAKNLLGNARDAVGINSRVAELLSGADFDGDSVMVIPNNEGKIQHTKPLKDLEGFDAKREYSLPKTAPEVGPKTGFNKQMEMGKISNLITDMTFQHATPEELARAVKMSQTVIDAEKHHLDWKRCYQEQNIRELALKYQGKASGGAGTLISRASGQAELDFEVAEYKPIIKETGALYYRPTDRVYKSYKTHKVKKQLYNEDGTPMRDENGKLMKETVTERVLDENGKPILVEKKATTTTTKMEKAFITGGDAYDLVSKARTPQELVYAEYANRTKALANETRKNSLGLRSTYSPSANKTYKEEVDSLTNKLAIAKSRAAYERQAIARANFVVKAKVQDNPSLSQDKDKLKKVKYQALEKARADVGLTKYVFDVTPKEWEAIQAGAVHDNTIMEILTRANPDKIHEYASPKTPMTFSPGVKSSIRSRANAGYSIAAIAEDMGLSVSQINYVLYDDDAQ